MGELFHGWKRKSGVLTLGIACVLMGLWMRSAWTADYVRIFPHQFHGTVIESSRQGLWLQVWSGQREPDPRKRRKRAKRCYQLERLALHLNEELTRRVPMGSVIATVFQPEYGEFEWSYQTRIPYWAIVLPMALLSAGFLLSKPRANRSTV